VSAPLVSVVVPVYNGERFLGEALESIFWQTYRDFEVIAIDDGSTDGTAEILRACPAVRYLYQQNRGLSAARNAGIAAARGELIALMDDDDVWAPDKLERQVGALRDHPDLGYATGLTREFVQPGTVLPDWIDPEKVGRLSPSPVPSTWLVRRESFERVGDFDTQFRLAEDVDWLARAKDMGIYPLLVPELLVLRRLHGANWSFNLEQGRRDLFRALRGSVARQRAAAQGRR
jgi:glycosyltransferase involved in cell wall biosynthesis